MSIYVNMSIYVKCQFMSICQYMSNVNMSIYVNICQMSICVNMSTLCQMSTCVNMSIYVECQYMSMSICQMSIFQLLRYVSTKDYILFGFEIVFALLGKKTHTFSHYISFPAYWYNLVITSFRPHNKKTLRVDPCLSILQKAHGLS